MNYLVCKGCNIKEAIFPHTQFKSCAVCDAARYTEDEDGRPMISWSVPQDQNSFDIK